MPSESPNERDDVDRLFARLAVAPVPIDFTERVLARTAARPTSLPWLIAGLASLAVLALSGYQLGANLAGSDALDLIAALLSDSSLLTTAPGDVVAALGEVMPWGPLLLAASSVFGVVCAASRTVPAAWRSGTDACPG